MQIAILRAKAYSAAQREAKQNIDQADMQSIGKCSWVESLINLVSFIIVNQCGVSERGHNVCCT